MISFLEKLKNIKRNCSIGITTGYGIDGQATIPGRCKILFLTSQGPERLWGHPASYPMGTLVFNR
jgi:hypothetical protein